MNENQKSQSIKVLLVEDNTDDVLIIKKMFSEIRKVDFELVCADRLQTAIEYCSERKFDVMLLDLGLPDSQGLDTFYKANTQIPETPIIVLSGLDDADIALKAVHEGAEDYLVKHTYNPSMFVRVVRYAIERYQMLRELDRKNKELLKLDKMKTEFIAIVSHELRTPLTGIIGSAQTMMRLKLTDEQKEHSLKIIYSEGKRLNLLIEQLLNISKIESGRFSLRIDFISIPEIVEKTLSITPIPEGVQVKVNFPDKFPQIDGDRNGIEQVLINILTNAVKYTPPGGKITVEGKEETDSVIVSIQDMGPGIKKEEISRIFEKFYRVDDAVSQKTRGSGLGLSIAKGIVELHGGKIWVESAEGKGSKFIFSIPKKYKKE
ncbi:MAG: hybrid sensor histidine kinase/response regulator [Elusimicrobia bacterium]|nr:hybrid sensor histidine kinase/response regulator [Elusimicrobiota bacterium]